MRAIINDYGSTSNGQRTLIGRDEVMRIREQYQACIVVWLTGCAGQASNTTSATPHFSREAAREAIRASQSSTQAATNSGPGGGRRARSDEELARRFVAALEQNSQAGMDLLFVNQRWQLWVCPHDSQSSAVVPEVPPEGDGDLSLALPAGRIILQELGPCTIERVVTTDPPTPARSAYAAGRTCESRYQETRDVVAILRCRNDRLMGIDLNDVAVVDGIWAVRDKVAWRVCQPASPLPTCARICRDGDPELCQQLMGLLDGPLRRAITQ